MVSSLKKYNTKVTPQTEQADTRQVKNNAGGFSFKVDEWDRLQRFLVLGTDKGTYYVKESDLTRQNVDFVKKLLKSNASEVIRRAVEVSDEGRAKSNGPALFVLALAMNTEGVDKSQVKAALPKVARTSTHLFEFAQYLENLGGWGRAKKEAVADWYASKTDNALATQVVKYRQRDGWTHRDLFRLAHPKGLNQGIGNFVLRGEVSEDTHRTIVGFNKAQNAKNVDELVAIVQEYKLPWETVPTQFHKEPKLWKALFDADLLGQTALVRNVKRIGQLGGFNDLVFAKNYADRLADQERIVKGRVHPINYLNASVSSGASGKVAQGLTDGFYNAFKALEPANKRTLVAVDISGSMNWHQAVGMNTLTCAQVSAAMAMFVARSEPFSMIRGFSSNFVDLGIDGTTDLKGAMRKVQSHNFGSTDCALPMVWAKNNGVEIDTFVVITDNETYAGRVHPHQALKQYRDSMGIPAKFVVMGVAATDFTIADPNDSGSLDVVGFDSAAPRFIADFSAGRV